MNEYNAQDIYDKLYDVEIELLQLQSCLHEYKNFDDNEIIENFVKENDALLEVIGKFQTYIFDSYLK